MTATSTADRLTALFAKSTTATLLESLVTLEAMPSSPERNWSRAKTIGELERRYPTASAAVEKAFDDAGESGEVDYVTVLVTAVLAEMETNR